MSSKTLAEQILDVLKEKGISLDDLAKAAKPASQPRRTSQNRGRGAVMNMATVEAAQTAPTAPKDGPKKRISRRGVIYGTSPVEKTALATFKARLNALEAAIPGLAALSLIRHEGRTAGGQEVVATEATSMNSAVWSSFANPGWTYIQTPDKFEKLSRTQIADVMISLGYSWHGKKQAWITKANGQPAIGRPYIGYKSTRGAGDIFPDAE
jgi:hypothetical protein